MTPSPERRSLILGGAGAAALAACPLAAHADRVVVPPQLPMTTLELARIGDDENAVMDALVYSMWRAPSMQGIVDAAPFTLKMDANSVPISYSVSFAAGGPFQFGQHLDGFQTPPVIDKLAVLFACEIVSLAGGAYKDAINAQVLDQQLSTLTRSQDAVAESNDVYNSLLVQTQSQASPGSAPFVAYVRNADVWGPNLAALMVSDSFIVSVLARPPELARRQLAVTLYKLRRLQPAAAPAVLARWKAPDLSKTVFPLAAGDPWPPNYLYKLYAEKRRPMQSLIARAMNTATTVKTGRHCRVLRRKCDPVYGTLNGEAVWDMLIDQAGPMGLLLNPQYPAGV